MARVQIPVGAFSERCTASDRRACRSPPERGNAERRDLNHGGRSATGGSDRPASGSNPGRCTPCGRLPTSRSLLSRESRSARSEGERSEASKTGAGSVSDPRARSEGERSERLDNASGASHERSGSRAPYRRRPPCVSLAADARKCGTEGGRPGPRSVWSRFRRRTAVVCRRRPDRRRGQEPSILRAVPGVAPLEPGCTAASGGVIRNRSRSNPLY